MSATEYPFLTRVTDILREREERYGDPAVLFADIAERWGGCLQTPLTAAQVALMMMDLKLARLAHNGNHRDSLMDILGYALCYARLKNWDNH